MEAFEVLLERYQQPLFAFCYRFCNDSAQAQDLVQEVFLRLIKTAKRYEPRAKFSTFLYTFAHNLCIDYVRRARKRQNVSLSDPIGDAGGPDPGRHDERRETGSGKGVSPEII